MLLFSGVAHAEVGHYIGADIYGGEWSLWEPRVPQNNFSFGAAASAGFAYELQAGKAKGHTHFLLHTGISAQTGMSFFFSPDSMFSTYGLSKRQDRYSKLVVQVPIQIGVQHKGFYLLAGFKLGYNVLATYKTQATRGDSIVPPYSLRLDSISPVNPISIDANLEIGVRFHGAQSGYYRYGSLASMAQYRLALFVDFGLLNFKKWPALNKKGEPFYGVFYDGENRFVDVLSTSVYVPAEARYDKENNPNGIKDALGRNIMAGIKFTVLFPTGRARYRYTRINRYYR